MKQDQHEARLLELLQSDPFKAMNNTVDSVLLKIEKDINKELLSLKKSNDRSEHLNTKMRSAGSQAARLYGLAKVHKKDIHLRPVLYLTGSSYENLIKILVNFFD